MIGNRRAIQLAGVSALALTTFGVFLPTNAQACVATAATTQVNNGGTIETTTNSMTVDCVATDAPSALFGTDVGGFVTGGATFFDYDGSGNDTLNILGGVISNTPPTNQTPAVTNLYGGAQLNGQPVDLFTFDGVDTVIIDGGATIAGGIDLGGGNDVFTLINGSLLTIRGDTGDDAISIQGGTSGSVFGDGNGVGIDGNDTIVVSGGVVNGTIFGGGGNDQVTVSGGQVQIAPGEVDSIGLEDGDDNFIMTGGALAGGVSGGAGIDTFAISGGTIGDFVAGGAGNDIFTISGTAVIASQLTAEDGDDVVNVTGGAINTFVDLGAGNDGYFMNGGIVRQFVLGGDGADQISVAGGTVGTAGGAGAQGVFGGAGGDTITVSGGNVVDVDGQDGNDTIGVSNGAVSGNVTGGDGDDGIGISGGTVAGTVTGAAGDDAITVSGGTVSGSVTGAAGDDDVTVLGGTINGGIDAETVNLFGGTILGDITGLSDNTLTIQSGALTLRNGVLFQGVGVNGTITDTNLAQAAGGTFNSQNFQGFDTFTMNNSTLGFAGANEQIANLGMLNGSTLFVSGATSLLNPGGGFGNLSVVNSTISMINGSTADVFSVGNLTVNGATIGLDLNPSLNVADQLSAAGLFNATGNNVIQVNIVGTPEFANSGIIPIAPVVGETAPVGGAPSAFFTVTGLPSTPGALFDYSVVTGSNGGLYLAVVPVDFADPLAPRVAIDSSILDNVIDTQDGIIGDVLLSHLGLLAVASRSDAAPNFGVYASGQLAHTEHDGFSVSTSNFRGPGPSFDADDASLAASVELDAAEYLGFDKSIGVDIGVFTGYATTNVHVDSSSLFDDVGQADNQSGMIGAYGLLRKGTTYGLVSATGFFGNTDIDNNVLNSTGDYDTAGVAVTGTVGKVFQLDQNWRLDVRGGLLGASFQGDAFEDDQGNDYGKSRISFGAVKFEPGVFAQYVLEDGKVVSPYVRLEVQQRFGYRNTSSLDNVDFDFDDADFSSSLSSGVNYQISKTTTLSTELRGKLSEDSSTFAGKLGIKAKF